MVNELAIRVDTTIANYPLVRLLIDGNEILTIDGHDQANDPADLLDTGALIPVDPPRRVAFYGCGCGEFGCAVVAGLIERRDNRVIWHDFCSPTGMYNSALPDPEYGPDPVGRLDPDLDTDPKRHRLPALTFDADQYMSTVEAAMKDRSWETRARAVIRHMQAARPDWTHWAARSGDLITVHHRVNRTVGSTDLVVPRGPVSEIATNLVELLDQGVDPRRIKADGMWS